MEKMRSIVLVFVLGMMVFPSAYGQSGNLTDITGNACEDTPILEITDLPSEGFAYTYKLQRYNGATWTDATSWQPSPTFRTITQSGKYRGVVKRPDDTQFLTPEYPLVIGTHDIIEHVKSSFIQQSCTVDYPYPVFDCEVNAPGDPDAQVTVTIENNITHEVIYQESGHRVVSPAEKFEIKNPGSYTLSINMGSCSKVTLGTYVEERPTVGIEGPDKACVGIEILYKISGGIPSEQYYWDLDGGSKNTIPKGMFEFNVKFDTYGKRTINIYVKKASCFQKVGSVEVEVYDLPKPTLSPLNGCVGQDIVFQTEKGKYSYLWTYGVTNSTGTVRLVDGGLPTSDYITLNFSDEGRFYITILYTDEFNCTPQQAKEFEVVISKPDFTGPLSVCNGQIATYTATKSGMANYTWTVTGGTIQGPSDGPSVNVQWNSLLSANRTISLNYDNTEEGYFNCRAGSPTTKTVSIYTPLISPANSRSCVGDIGTYTTDEGSGYIWQVFREDGTTPVGADQAIISNANSRSASVEWKKAGTYKITVKLTTADGCVVNFPTKENVTVNPLPVPVITPTTGNFNPCLGVTTSYSTYMDADINPSSYLWSVSPASAGIIVSGKNSNTVNVRWLAATPDAKITVSYSKLSSRCTGTTSRQITISAPSIESGNPLVCNNTEEVYTTQEGMTNYQWSISPDGAGTIVSGGTTHSVTVKWVADGVLTANYTNRGGCMSTSGGSMIVNMRKPPVPQIADAPAKSCLGYTSVYASATNMAGYRWSVIPADAGVIDRPQAKEVSIEWKRGGFYSIKLEVQDENGCWSTAHVTKPVEVTGPIIDDAEVQKSACLDSKVTYSVQDGMNDYQWVITPATGYRVEGGDYKSRDLAVTWDVTGEYTISVSYKDPSSDGSCTPTPANLKVTVHPLPSITNDQTTFTQCSDDIFNLAFTSDATSPTTYAWRAELVSGDIEAMPMSGNKNISMKVTNSGTTHAVIKFTATATTGGCSSPEKEFTLTVIPKTAITTPNLAPVICSGSVFALDFASNVTEEPVTYSWSAEATPATVSGFGTTGVGNISHTLVNNGNTPAVVTYIVTPNTERCGDGIVTAFTVTVQPVSTILNNPIDLCPGVTTPFPLLSNVATADFKWSVEPNANVEGAADGTGKTIVFNLTNKSYVQQQLTYHITPIVAGCEGNTDTLIFNLQPRADVSNTTVDYTVCSQDTVNIPLTSHVENVTFRWIATSSSGDISGYADETTGKSVISQELVNKGITPQRVTYTVTPYYLDCAGEAKTFTVTVNPRPRPVVEPAGANNVCIGETVTYNVQAGMNDYQWIISPEEGRTIINGGGDTQDFITVQWDKADHYELMVGFTSVATGCPAADTTIFPIQIQPLPVVTNVADTKSICPGTNPSIILTANIVGTTFKWTAAGSSDKVTGFPVSGTGHIDHLLHNISDAEQRVTYTVIPVTPGTYGCEGTPKIFTVTVYPAARVTNTQSEFSICSRAELDITLSSNIAAASFTWTAKLISGSATGFMDGNGTEGGHILQTLRNTGATDAVIHYEVTPSTNGCEGTPRIFTVTVLPELKHGVSDPKNGKACLNEIVTYTGPDGMTDYQWNIPGSGTILGGGTATDNFVQVQWNSKGTYTMGLVYTGAGLCTIFPENSTFTVTVNDLPEPTISSPNNGRACLDVDITYYTQVGMTDYQWTYPAQATLVKNNGDNIVLRWRAEGSYKVTVNYTNENGCQGALAAEYEIYIGSPSLSGPDEICKGALVKYFTDQDMLNYKWEYPRDKARLKSGGGAFDSFIELDWIEEGTYTVSVSYSTVFGCGASTISKAIRVVGVTRPILEGDQKISCTGREYTYTTQSGMSNYKWDVPTSLGDIVAGGGASDNFVIIRWNELKATVTLGVNFVNTGGCYDLLPTKLEVQINPLKNTFGYTQNTSCFDLSDGKIKGAATGGFPPYKYSIDAGEPQDSPLFENLSKGRHVLHVTDAQGCFMESTTELSAPRRILVDEAIQTKPVTDPGRSDGEIRVIASGGIPPLNYTLKDSGRAPQSSGVFSNLKEGNYLIDITDNNGCVTPTMVTVKEPFIAKVKDMVVTQPLCPKGKGEATFNLSLSEKLSTQYDLYFNSVIIASEDVNESKFVHLADLAPGTYMIILTYYTDYGPVIEKDQVTFIISDVIPDRLNCSVGHITCLDDPTPDGYIRVSVTDYTGNIPSALSQYKYILYDKDKNVVRDWQYSSLLDNLPAGIYYTAAMNVNGCVTDNPAGIEIKMPSLPLTLGVVSKRDPSCFNFSDASITLAARGGWNEYSYSLDGKNFNSTGIFDNLTGGNYTFFVQDKQGCVASVNTTFDNPSEIVISSGGVSRTLGCYGDQTAEIYVVASGGKGSLSYELVQKNITNRTGVFSNLKGGRYDIRVSDDSGCSVTYSIFVNEPPQMKIVSRIDYNCYQNITLWVDAQGGTAPYAYDFGNGFISDNFIEGLKSGTYDLSCRVKDARGCIETIVHPIDIEPLKIEAEIANITNIRIHGQGGVEPYSYSFNGKDFDTNNVIELLTNGMYMVHLRDALGCTVSCEVEIKNIEIKAANFFTPNGDGINDNWQIELYQVDNLTQAKDVAKKNFSEAFPNAIIRIFDRTGRTIKVLRGNENGWDGILNGTNLPSDTYWYEVRLTPTSKAIKIGCITITL